MTDSIENACFEAPRYAPDALVGTTVAAAELQVSRTTLRKNAKAWGLTVETDASGGAQYLWSEVRNVAADRKSQPRPAREQIQLSVEDAQECLRIANGAVSAAVRQSPGLRSQWDEMYEDALLGVAEGLAKPNPNFKWQVRCFTCARWAVANGVRKRSPISGHLRGKGVRVEDLSPSRLPALSWEAEWQEAIDTSIPSHNPYTTVLNRLYLDVLMGPLSAYEKMLLVSTFGYEFLAQEIADEVGRTRSAVSKQIVSAMTKLRQYWEIEPGQWSDPLTGVPAA